MHAFARASARAPSFVRVCAPYASGPRRLQYLPHYKQLVRDFASDLPHRAPPHTADPDLLVVGAAVLGAMGRRDCTSLLVIARQPERLAERVSPRVRCVNALFSDAEVQVHIPAVTPEAANPSLHSKL